MTNEKQDALRALDQLYKEAARMGQYHGSGLIKDCYALIRAALTEAPKVDVDIEALKTEIYEKLWKKHELLCEGHIDSILGHLTTHYDLVKKSEG